MLHINNLSVLVEEKEVLKDLQAQFQCWLNYCILGKNGSGKSTLAMSIMWHPQYSVVWDQTIVLEWEQSFLDQPTQELLTSKWLTDLNHIDITALTTDLRSKLGIFVAFQQIPEIKWVKLFEFLRTIYNVKRWTQETFLSFKKIVEPLVASLHIERDFLRRDLNVGFSGWERRKIEILQLKLLKPRYIILDEVDSWLDVDAFKDVAQLLREFNDHHNTFIIITHYFQILDYVPIDHVYLMEGWTIIWSGGVELAWKVKETGFGGL